MKHINIVGYIKDFIASLLFLLTAIIFLLIKDLNKIKKLIIILLLQCKNLRNRKEDIQKLH